MFFWAGHFRDPIPDQARAGSPVARPGDPLSPEGRAVFGVHVAVEGEAVKLSVAAVPRSG